MAQRSDGTARIDHIALIGNFLPRKCGLATYTTDVYTAFSERFPDMRIDVYAMDDHPGRHDYPAAVTRAIPQNRRHAYIAAAADITASGAQAVWVQHEYGIYGGPAGDLLLAMLDRLTVPVIVTLHTILEHPGEDEHRVMKALLTRSARVIVMAEKGRAILERVYGADPRQIVMIPHGVPDRPLVAPDTMKPRFGWEGRKVVLTFGLLAPNKGIETMIEAMPAIVERNPDALYVVLGATHPHLIEHEGEVYRKRLHMLAAKRGVAEHVRFIDAFVEHDELLDYLQAADVYATPYDNPEQITSGTLSYAVGVGKAVVSTPYVHATEILADDHGVLVDFRDDAGFARAIDALLADDDARAALSQRAYQRGRTMIWPRLAEAGYEVLLESLSRRPHRFRRAEPHFAVLPPDLRTVERMSDSTGMLQHSVYAVPDRHHGYCIDDNARALILMTRMPECDDAMRERWTSVYAAFLQHSWNPDARRFRNFMNFDRTWCEDAGSEDSNGRALWALGVTAAEAKFAKYRDWAGNLFDATAGIARDFGSPRAAAFAMLGAAAILGACPGDKLATDLLEHWGDQLTTLLDAARRPEWQWFEIVLAYDNARLPEALIRAGLALGRDDFLKTGLETLNWIIARQTSPEGRFRAVGTDSFGREYADPLPFDQQPLEAQATIDACAAAFEATGDRRWIAEAKKAYGWYVGINDLDLPLATPRDGGCYDGLMPTGLNRNQGAESILALQLASCAISALSKAGETVKDRDRAVA
ncbi:glycosyltransferase family 4 protein [Stakelama saccharophila]|uniref:Glycosyltransferase n=1 Tax=Stakelama saccharophila TaxID=3075605 RepID=A0ABZ0B9S1_9SPHN|nr:glycosyltransferase [Stakelama sp. W311]WNO54155.1 glycosyltransferase [Stakelama sp. W311]